MLDHDNPAIICFTNLRSTVHSTGSSNISLDDGVDDNRFLLTLEVILKWMGVGMNLYAHNCFLESSDY